ncbi:hypothetical protein Y1Q_0008685 [Alligator mississippiensis]|uniref:Uncharacterized protein n=1 Tax=Alligator mississippiensis TaxID=8496 RepID=A0A151N9R7_ALLMI|nr:hypothetical protein Y1Q_0008685 [Alligator mississippiensis]
MELQSAHRLLERSSVHHVYHEKCSSSLAGLQSMVLKELFKAITTLPQTRKKTNPHSSLLSDAHHLYFSCRKLRAKFDGCSTCHSCFNLSPKAATSQGL